MSESFVNFMGGSPLNRLSWLRPSHAFLNAVVASPTTRWILFNAGQPLIASHPETRGKSLAYLTTTDVKSLLGPTPYFGQPEKHGDAPAASDVSALESARHVGSPIVFLGLHETAPETAGALPSSDFADAEKAVANLEGTPFFSIDVQDFSTEEVDVVLQGVELAKTGIKLTWSEPRGAMGVLDAFTAGVFANARSLTDWNTRNKFCPACGSPTYSLWGGWKISCRSLLPWADLSDRKPCPTTRGLHNFTHPRTDPVVIMIAIDQTGEKVLLGRSKKFPGKFYSALAGFIEPGETFEDAVAREMWEEAGVKVWDVKYHSGQPWPFPANLMVGFYATADSSKPLRTDLDNELEDARWYTRAEVLAVINHPQGLIFSGRDHKKMAAAQEERSNVPGGEAPKVIADEEKEGYKPQFKLPPLTAIAGVLIKDWAEGKISNVGAKGQVANL